MWATERRHEAIRLTVSNCEPGRSRGTLSQYRIPLFVLALSLLVPGAAHAQFVERFETWSSTSNGAWQTKDLSVNPFNVPGNAVVEIAIVNTKNTQTLSAGVRAVGSSLDRRLDLDGPATNAGWDIIVMHVQANSVSQIHHYAENKNFVEF